MPLTDDGAEVIAGRLIDEETPFDEANAHIGVGDSNDSFNTNQSDLAGLSDREGMSTDYPQRDGNKLTFRSVFESGSANFSWEEWGVFNDSSGGVMLNRIVEDNGEKVEGHVWEFTVEITFQAQS